MTNAGVVTIGAQKVTSSKIEQSIVQVAVVTVTHAEIIDLVANPKELVAAPGAGKQIVFMGAILKLNAGSEVLTESADNLRIEYDAGSGAAISEAIESTGWIDQATDFMTNAIPVKDAIDASADVENKNIALANTDGDIAGNVTADATLTIEVQYRIIDFA